MKKYSRLVAVLAALCIAVACSKKEDDTKTVPPEIPESDPTCLLTKINYSKQDPDMPYYWYPTSLTYDDAGRITGKTALQSVADTRISYTFNSIKYRVYINGVADSNLVEMKRYMLDADKQVDYYIHTWYNKPENEDDYDLKDSIDYQYDAAGHFVTQQHFGRVSDLWEELRFTWEDGNMVKEERTRYNGDATMPAGTDVFTYTYDTTAWHPGAVYLYGITEYDVVQVGKPNKNNVTGIEFSYDAATNSSSNYYKTMAYTYTVKDGKLIRADLKATSTLGHSIDTWFDFEYTCK